MKNQNIPNNERNILKGCYGLKRIFNYFNKLKNPNYNKKQDFETGSIRISYILDTLKKPTNYSQNTLKKVDNIGRHFINLLKKSANLENEAAFHPQSNERSKALGYLGSVLYPGTMNFYVNQIYDALGDAGYDKKIIKERLKESINSGKKVLETTRSTMYSQGYRDNKSLTFFTDFDEDLRVSLESSKGLEKRLN